VGETRRYPAAAQWLGLLLILVVAGTLRLKAVGFGNDFLTFQVDEHRNVLLPLGLSWSDLRPRAAGYSVSYDYPALLWYMLFLLDRLVFRVFRLFGLAREWGAWREVFEQNPLPFFLLGRTLSVGFGTATVGLVYLLGRRIFSPAHGLLAAGFLGVTFLHVRDSAMATLDAPVTFFMTLSLLGAVAVLQQGRLVDYLLAGGAAGLATATKYNGCLIAIALVVAHGLRTRRAGIPFRQAVIALRLVGALLLAALVFALLNPYLLIEWPKALKDVAWLSERVKSGQYRDIGPGWWYHFSVSLRYGMGVGLLALALGGLVQTLWRREPAAVVLASFVVPFFLIMGSAKLIFVRYVEPLLPSLCLFAAAAAWALAGALRRPALSPWLVMGLGLVAAFQPFTAALAYGRIVRHSDTRVNLYRFIASQLPPEAAVATYGPTVTWRSTIPRFQPILYQKPREQSWPDALAVIKTRGVRYFVTHHSTLDVFSPPMPELEVVLRQSATLIQEFPLAEDGAAAYPVYDEVDPYHLPIGGFAGVRRPGPLVRLYRLD
jgi:hypothetical protein